jgi:hypothetical protein
MDALRLSIHSMIVQRHTTLGRAEPSHHHPLRHNWNAMPTDALVDGIDANMRNCSKSVHHLLFGYGSVLHSWATTMCLAMEQGASMTTFASHFVWDGYGTPVCPDKTSAPLTCFCGHRANSCFGRPPRVIVPTLPPATMHAGDGSLRGYQTWAGCPTWSHRDGSTPSLWPPFDGSSPNSRRGLCNLCVRRRSTSLALFGPRGAPDELVTVHMRWGDKAKDRMTLQPASRYADAAAKVGVSGCPVA